MLETLTGRLKWEHTVDGIRVVIPARLNWGAIRRLMVDLCPTAVGFISIFGIACCVGFLRGLSFQSFLNSNGMRDLYFVSLGCCTGLIIARLVPRLFGETVVTVSPAQITIEWNFLIRRSKEVFPSVTVRGFRFVEPWGPVPLKNRLRQNEFQFFQAQSTRSFGEGLTHNEAEALIAAMIEVYSFPN